MLDVYTSNAQVEVSVLGITLVAELELLEKMLLDRVRRYSVGKDHVIIQPPGTLICAHDLVKSEFNIGKYQTNVLEPPLFSEFKDFTITLDGKVIRNCYDGDVGKGFQSSKVLLPIRGSVRKERELIVKGRFRAVDV
jgi:hypothetical protein